MSEDEKVELVIKAAKAGFFAAIEWLAVIEVLKAGNIAPIHEAIEADDAGLCANLIRDSLFYRLLMGVMLSYDPPRKGDYHLKVGMDLVSDPAVRAALIVRRVGSDQSLTAAERSWVGCLTFPALDRLRALRNKEGAHRSELNTARPIRDELVELARKTADVSEKLAHGTGIVTLSLDSQIVSYTESAKAFWKRWT